ncbi:hypothetical protein NDU88_002046 [Pleurodeles waltl]|uniref:Uncharacterized protein n=1 Tax=Pleurodeles waltl TaxID=8319 RepID=A0AAV7KXU0_PLEWA|nr:hypothetical protein NDU88_002046 [Pleurodeles waltl]
MLHKAMWGMGRRDGEDQEGMSHGEEGEEGKGWFHKATGHILKGDKTQGNPRQGSHGQGAPASFEERGPALEAALLEWGKEEEGNTSNPREGLGERGVPRYHQEEETVRPCAAGRSNEGQLQRAVEWRIANLEAPRLLDTKRKQELGKRQCQERPPTLALGLVAGPADVFSLKMAHPVVSGKKEW